MAKLNAEIRDGDDWSGVGKLALLWGGGFVGTFDLQRGGFHLENKARYISFNQIECVTSEGRQV